MATFYIQLENKLLQISGDLTAANISKALGYVPVSPNVTNELSQRVDNITFDSLKDNPFLQDGSGELNIVDEAGNIIAKIDAEGIHSVDFIAGEHRLSNKTDKTYVDEAIKNVEVDLTGYATEEYVNNIDFYNINNNPIADGEENSLILVDENGNIGLQLEEDGLYVKDVIADGHTLSNKADKSELSNYATKDEVSDLVDMSIVTELQGKVNTLIYTDTNKSVRDITVDVLTETLVSETATEAYDTLAEMSAWIKSHPEDASAMNTAIQKNATDIQSNATAITNLDAAYKAADTKVLTDAQEYTDNINFFTIKDNPIVNNNDGNLTFVDETGYIGLKVTEDGIIAKDVVTPEHTLSNKADKSELSNYATKEELSTSIDELGISELNAILVDTDAEVDDPIVPDYVTETELNTALSNKMDKVTLANVATSGSYNDLSNKPTIPTAVTESTVSGWGFTKNTGTYSKPNGGIPKTDLASAVQTSLGKADTALQSYTEQYKGTVTGVKINGTTKNPSNGVVDLGTVITSHQTLKTINGESIVGSGDITISGGSSSGSEEVYLTPFTVEQFCTGYVELTDEQRNELINAASQNRIIGMPYNGTQTGYMVADYKYELSEYEDVDDFWSLDLGVIYNGAHYTNSISSNGSINFMVSRIAITPFKPLVYTVAVEDGHADVSDDHGYTDNCVFWVDGECSEVFVHLEPSEIGKTVRFLTGESCTLEFSVPVYWANGEIPTIEPYTNYELSLVANMDYAFNAVLTPFKPVE